MNDDTFDRQAFYDSIVSGQIMRLDNIGIRVSLDQLHLAYRRYADTIGRDVETLTDAERQQALLNWILDSSPRDPA